MPAGSSEAELLVSSPVSEPPPFRRSTRHASMQASRQLSGEVPLQHDIDQVVTAFKKAVAEHGKSRDGLRLAWHRVIDAYLRLKPSDPGAFGSWARDTIGDQYLVDALPHIFSNEFTSNRTSRYMVKAAKYLRLAHPAFAVLYLGTLVRTTRTLDIIAGWIEAYPKLSFRVDIYPRIIDAYQARITKSKKLGPVGVAIFADPRITKGGLKPQDITAAALNCEFVPVSMLPKPLTLSITTTLPTDAREKDPGGLVEFKKKLNATTKAKKEDATSGADGSHDASSDEDDDHGGDQDGVPGQDGVEDEDGVEPHDGAEDRDGSADHRRTAVSEDIEEPRASASDACFAPQTRPVRIVMAGSLPRSKPEQQPHTPQQHVETPSAEQLPPIERDGSTVPSDFDDMALGSDDDMVFGSPVVAPVTPVTKVPVAVG
ncbi:hypothetical protein QBC33DRAFT_564502 [Phialemonium atrogriseum]|uniref:Uncharacterized protein n=1 Tax=Phialemonium atrogriseum TaxID=1093897 RepID=A0AAJ0FC25_9PEZI|nr:uncharacterized protein QBC33DRAFT_564502 [Phialemonium atrogriseum]KAK1761697.1 hypothetical protein QBC33DRAFT_564502 [Phialemonium atrogriseum]